MKDFDKITVRSDWGYFDRLDGKDLIKDERLEIRWPDGSASVETIQIDKSSYTISDMGSPTNIHTHRAFVDSTLRGLGVRLWLGGLMARRVDNSVSTGA